MDDIDLLIERAMQQLSASHPHFGLTKSGTRQTKMMEKAFQEELFKALRASSGNEWQWCRERRFDTKALLNSNCIDVDVFGEHAELGSLAIELKYVTMSYLDLPLEPREPSDPPAFSYDIANDCLKLELVMHGGDLCTTRERTLLTKRQLSTRIRSYALALTNCPRYWPDHGDKPYNGWAREFQDRFRKVPVVLEGTIQTRGTGEPGNCVYKQGRCHISFGLAWEGRWHDYRPDGVSREEYRANNAEFYVRHGSPGRFDEFRYLLLKPTGVVPDWSGRPMAPGTIPFLTEEARRAFDAMRE